MSEEETTRGVELLLQEPEIVAWLSDYRRDYRPPEPDDVEDDDPPQAA